ncbi:hypothetical protein MRX96_051086 [Rhipicephalus microplus]
MSVWKMAGKLLRRSGTAALLNVHVSHSAIGAQPRLRCHGGVCPRAAIRALVSKTRFKVLGPSWVKDHNAVARYVKNAPTIQSRRPLDAYLALYEYAFVNVLMRGPSQRWPLSAFSTRCRYEISTWSVYVPALLFNVSLPFDKNGDSLQLPPCQPSPKQASP